MANCSVCSSVGVRKVVDGYLAEGVSGAGISRDLGRLGLNITPEVVNRHRTHWEPPNVREPGTRKRDFAVIVRDRMMDAVDALVPEVHEDGTTGLDPIMMKDLQPAIGSGLKAQALLDKRDQKKVTQNFWVQLFTGQQTESPQLDDGLTIDGDFEDLDGE